MRRILSRCREHGHHWRLQALQLSMIEVSLSMFEALVAKAI